MAKIKIAAKLVTANAAQLIKEANVIIDFTTPESTLDNLKSPLQIKQQLLLAQPE